MTRGAELGTAEEAGSGDDDSVAYSVRSIQLYTNN